MGANSRAQETLSSANQQLAAAGGALAERDWPQLEEDDSMQSFSTPPRHADDDSDMFEGACPRGLVCSVVGLRRGRQG